MEQRQKQVLDAYRRVQTFMRAHPVREPASYAAAGQLLDEVLGLVMVHAIRQATGRRQAGAETRRQRQLVQALRERQLRPISKIATAVLRGAPGIEVALRIPGPSVSIVKLLAEATAIRTAVTAYAPVLVAHGRPANFLEQLDAAVDAVRETLHVRADTAGARVLARNALAEELRRGRNAVEMIDATVVASFADNPEVLAAWRTARRVHAVAVVQPASQRGTPDDGASGLKVA